jgi:Domain of unknown function (DUF4337)
MADELELPHIPAGDHQLGKWVAIFTAIVATMGGIVGHEASQIANEAILYKNEAVLKKTDASDQWAYYQAVSTKSHLMELAKELTPAQSHSDYEEKLAKYAQQKDNALEEQVKAADAKSAALREPRQNLFFALALLQIAISVASVTVLTRQAWLFAIAGVGALSGIAFWILAVVGH